MSIRYYIIGIKHCGKSTVGKQLAKDLNIPFYDLDEQIEKSIGSSVRDFYIKEGQEAFQKVELECLKHIQNLKENFICATGGGICDNKKAFNLMKSLGNSIYINTSFETVYSRILKSGKPAFLKSDNPKSEFKKIYLKRNNLYKEIASLEIDGKGFSPKVISDKILKLIKELQIARK